MIRALERRTPTRPAGGRSHASPPEAARSAPTPTPPRKPRASYSYFRTWSFFAGSRKHQPVHPSPPDRPAPDVEREHRMDALEKIRREGAEHAERLGKVARLKRRAEEKRAEAAKRKKTNAEKTARLDGDAAETSRAVLSAGDTSDSDSDAPSRGGLAMDWRAKRV